MRNEVIVGLLRIENPGRGAIRAPFSFLLS
jgi:hypothetical protein